MFDRLIAMFFIVRFALTGKTPDEVQRGSMEGRVEATGAPADQATRS